MMIAFFIVFLLFTRYIYGFAPHAFPLAIRVANLIKKR